MRGIDRQSGMLTADFLASHSSVRGEIPAEASAVARGESDSWENLECLSMFCCSRQNSSLLSGLVTLIHRINI